MATSQLATLPSHLKDPDRLNPRNIPFMHKQQLANRVEQTLTPGEANTIKYHRKNLPLGAKAPDGRPMTALMVGPRITSGTHKDKYASVPSFVPGHNNNKPMTEGQALRYWQKEIDAGKWPVYKTGPELNARSKEIHTIMDVDAENYVPVRPSLGRR